MLIKIMVEVTRMMMRVTMILTRASRSSVGSSCTIRYDYMENRGLKSKRWCICCPVLSNQQVHLPEMVIIVECANRYPIYCFHLDLFLLSILNW